VIHDGLFGECRRQITAWRQADGEEMGQTNFSQATNRKKQEEISGKCLLSFIFIFMAATIAISGGITLLAQRKFKSFPKSFRNVSPCPATASPTAEVAMDAGVGNLEHDRQQRLSLICEFMSHVGFVRQDDTQGIWEGIQNSSL